MKAARYPINRFVSFAFERRSSRLACLCCMAVTSACAQHKVAEQIVPPPPTTMERQIHNAVDAGDGDYVTHNLQVRLAAEPDNLPARLQLARLYLDHGSPELALEHYRLAAARFPASSELQLDIVKTLRSMGLRAEAATGLEAFLNDHPQQTPEMESWLGILRDEMGEWPQGEKAHRAALAISPRTGYLHNNLGYNLLKQGKKEEAAQEFQRAVELNPHSAVARNNLAMAVVSQPEKAVANWQSVSDPATAHSNLAAAYIEQHRYEEARKELGIALGYNRYHLAALHNLQLVSELDGQPARIEMSTPVEKSWHKVVAALRKAFVEEEE